MHPRRRSDQSIAESGRVPMADDCFNDDAATKISDGGIHRQNSIAKTTQQVIFQPRFHGSALLPGRHQLRPSADFLNGNSAEANLIFRNAS